jgi:hypothetical protein
MREELVTASAILCAGVVTRLCAFIPDPAPARLIRLAGLSLKSNLTPTRRHRQPRATPANLIHKTVHAHVHHHAESQKREQH